ncbi:MAG: protein kinase, partial [Chloroflexota bacterium]
MSDLIGKTLGPYRILEQIGVGGMATVYRAYQPSVDRDVAIKVLPHYLSEDRQFAERFQREAHAIARLEHAHILPVHDYGECDGVTYIAMRYVHAGTLKDRMAKGPLPLDEINRLISQIGSALDYAHAQGVIHRDVKPSNVLIDEQGNTYLTDFGLARMLEASQQLTASGVGLGTPAYMSPEQGQGIKVDHRSDIYSLGVMLYEMVTGRVPYEAETPMAVVLKHITGPLPLPRAVAPNVPEAIEKVILRAMAKDPAYRFQSACNLVQALNQAVRKVSPPEPAQPGSASRSARSALVPIASWGWIIVSAIGLVGLALGTMLWLGRGPERQVAAASPTLASTFAPSATLVVAVLAPTTPTPTSTPTAPPTVTPTPTVRPTRTPTPQPAWVTDFAEPILAAIANRQPDFQDDFSSRAGGWTRSDSCAEWKLKYVDGEMVVSACHVSREMWYTDFVIEMDARFLPGSSTDTENQWRFHYRQNGTNYFFGIKYSGNVLVGFEELGSPSKYTNIPDAARAGLDVNHVLVIAKDQSVALFINDRPVYYSVLPPRWKNGGMMW